MTFRQPGPWGPAQSAIEAQIKTEVNTGAQMGPLAFQFLVDLITIMAGYVGIGVTGPTGSTLETRTGEIQQHVTDVFNALSAQIAGGSGPGSTDPALLAAIANISAALAQQLKQDEAHPADADAPAIDDQTAALEDIARRAEELQQPITEAFTLDDPRLAAALAAGEAGEGQPFLPFLPTLLRAVGALLWRATPYLAPAVLVAVIEKFPALAGLFQQAGETTAEAFAEGLEQLHRPMQAVINRGALTIIRNLQDEMFNLGQTTPENVDAAAARLLAIAGGFGMAAHLIAIGAEKIVGTKHLGFPQLAAYLADAASFGKIAQNTVGAQIDAALRSPARRRALAQFRSELPDPMSFERMVHWRQASDVDLREYYRQQGWTEDDVQRVSQSIFRTASPRELAMVFEDGEPDQTWALRMLQRAGFNDEDADRLLRGVLTRAQKAVRQAFVSAVTANADEGIYSPEQAAAALRDFGLTEPLVQTNLLIAAHKRTHREVTERTAALVSAHLLGATTEDELLTALAALGIDDRARLHHLSVARIKRGAKVFAKSEATDQASENRARRDATDAALAAFRRFTLDEDGLRQTLSAIGVHDQELDALVQLAAVQRTPAPKLEEVLSAGAAAQRERKLQGDQVLELQKRGQLTQAAATERLVALGFTREIAADEAALVAAKLVRPPDVAKPPTATELQREQQRDATTGAVDLFRAGLTDQTTLRASLVRAGYDSATAEAIVVREADRLAADSARKARQLADAEFRKEQTRVVDEAVSAFRAGVVDAAGLEQTLVAAGLSSTVAAATVEREQNIGTSRAARAEEAAVKSDAARILKADQDAAIFAFRRGLLDADGLEQELVNAGTEATLAAAMRRREELRPRATPRASAASASTSSGP